MGLFTADLFRSLAIGFVLGAALVLTTMGGASIGENVVPAAVAAPVQ